MISYGGLKRKMCVESDISIDKSTHDFISQENIKYYLHNGTQWALCQIDANTDCSTCPDNHTPYYDSVNYIKCYD